MMFQTMRKFIPMVKHALPLLSILLVSCGGGGGDGGTPGGGSNDQFTLSTNSLDFVAESPSVNVSALPLTATVDSNLTGTLYVIANISGSAVSSVSNVTINQNSGTVYVSPVTPQTLGVGSHSGTVTITMCMNDPTCAAGQLVGSPKTVNVNYQVKSSVKLDTVMPNTVTANQSGNVILRGHGFTTGNITSVLFGAVNATAFNVISDTEIHATYPALVTNTYPIQVNSDQGTVSFSANLMVDSDPAYSPTAVGYPGAPTQILNVLYNADQEALYVVTSYFNSSNFNTTSRMTNELVRYQFGNGQFVSMSSKVIPLLQSIAISPDGLQLLALTDKQVIHLNPTSLAELSTPIASNLTSSEYFKDIVVMNDGNALITTGFAGSGGPPTYIYPLSNPQFFTTNHRCTDNATPALSADGSSAVFIQGILSPVPPLCEYNSSTGLFSELTINANQKQCRNSGIGTCLYPALDQKGEHIAVIDLSLTVRIYDQNYVFLGQLPIQSEAVIFSPDGSRAYAYDSATVIRTYDLTAATVNNEFQEMGTGTSLTGSPGIGVERMAISPDGATLFIAGRSQVIVQPLP